MTSNNLVPAIAILFLAFVIASPIWAAPTAPAPYCEITGEIIEVREIKEKSDKPKTWREQWGQPDYKTSTNVQLRIKRVVVFHYQEGGFDMKEARKRCDVSNVPREAAYKACSSPINKNWEGREIWAVTHFGGDELGVHNCLKSVINITHLGKLGE